MVTTVKKKLNSKRWYLKHKVKPHWTASKRAWVKCAFCGSVSHFKPLIPHDPEVFSFIYGGRGKIQKISGQELQKDIPEFYNELQQNYIKEIKAAVVRFLYCYCSQEEIVALMQTVGVKLAVEVEAQPIIPRQSALAIPSFFASGQKFESSTKAEVKAEWRVEKSMQR